MKQYHVCIIYHFFNGWTVPFTSDLHYHHWLVVMCWRSSSPLSPSTQSKHKLVCPYSTQLTQLHFIPLQNSWAEEQLVLEGQKKGKNDLKMTPNRRIQLLWRYTIALSPKCSSSEEAQHLCFFCLLTVIADTALKHCQKYCNYKRSTVEWPDEVANTKGKAELSMIPRLLRWNIVSLCLTLACHSSTVTNN